MQFRFLASMLLILSGWGIAAVSGAEAPQPSRIGRQIENFKLGDVRGKAHSLADWKDSAVVVVAFIGVECPLAKQYAGRLVEIAGKYQDQGVRVVAIDSNQQDSLAEITAI